MNRVAGVSTTSAAKSRDMRLKTEYINELHGAARNVVFATGTPISNSMVEMFVMQRYLQRAELEQRGLHIFDNWAATFGEVVSALELKPSGKGYRIKERFSKFVDLPELMNLFRLFADIMTAEMLNLPVPEILTGKPIVVDAEPSPELLGYVDDLVRRAERIHNKDVRDASEDNMLMVTNDGRNAALDMRLIDPALPDFEGSKVNRCVRNVFEIYQETAAEKSAQMIFCDLSTPNEAQKYVLPMKETAPGVFELDKDALEARSFTNVYDDIRTKLILLGVKPSEIAYIHEADTAAQKEKLFTAVRNGDVRVLIGSTSKMGTGTNAQKRLIALHNLDCPWRPSDLEQRIGRGLRFGNENAIIRIYNYVTRNSFVLF